MNTQFDTSPVYQQRLTRKAGFYLCIFLTTALTTGCENNIEPVAAAPEKQSTTPVMLNSGDQLSLKTLNEDASDPLSIKWRNVEEYQLNTMIAPPVHPSVALRSSADTGPFPVKIKIAKNQNRLFIRLRWEDTTNNVKNAFEEFNDAVAVQFALQGGEQTSFMMGSPKDPVNIWLWKADQPEAQNLAAGGFGSTTLLNTDTIASKAVYHHKNNDSGEWILVLSRALDNPGDYQVDLQNTFYITLAVWQGADKQRDGWKRTSIGWIVVGEDEGEHNHES